ncbi:MAG: SDR family oxidoreductase [Hyphomicrobiales bacterium]|nr:SDR family oxidoreductase [Hyphomicrobiales bacterium]
MRKLDGRTAIVTGSGRGIGRAIAVKLASEGAQVVVNDLDDAPAADTVAAIERDGGAATAFAGDVTAPDFGEGIVEAALDRFGGLDIIVNNAGYIWNSTIQNHSDEQWQAMLDVHATAPFRLLRAASTYLRATAKREMAEDGMPRCRKVVNISSTSGWYGAATQLAYSAGKAAVVGMTRTLAREWGRYNVTVNCVAFGHIETRLTQRYDDQPDTIRVKDSDHKVGLSREAYDEVVARTPLPRVGTPTDAAGAVYLLCIPESDFISGQVLLCSGGMVY